MIFPLGGFLVGAIIGGVRAKQRDGLRKDIAQWAVVHGMIGAMIGLFVLIFVMRSAV